MVSIITPVLNGAKFIENNLKSIASLDIPHQHIVVDGGSTDGTREIIDQYENVTLIDEQGRNGMYAAIHQGFAHATGDYLAYVNCDDLVIKEGFEKMYSEIIRDNSLDLVYSNAYLSNPKNDELIKSKANRFGSFFLRKGIMPFVQPSSIYTKDIYKRCGGLDYSNFKISGDLDMFQRFTEQIDFKYMYKNIYSTIFLKYADSLGNRNVVRHREENKLLTYYTTNVIVKILYKLTKIL